MNDRGLTVALLGPLEVQRDGVSICLSSGRVRTLLAVLAMSAGDTVPVQRLAPALWGEDMPVNVRRSVQTLVTRLRRALGSQVVRSLPGGHLLDVDPDRVDVLRFRRVLAEAARAQSEAQERVLLGEALALWRGSPYESIDSDLLRTAESSYLIEAYLGAVERRIDLDLSEGCHQELVPELIRLTELHPLRESLWARLLVTLGRCRRPAEGLASYERLRRLLAMSWALSPRLSCAASTPCCSARRRCDQEGLGIQNHHGTLVAIIRHVFARGTARSGWGGPAADLLRDVA
ncbi:BTAD domain-containing putative transcriptional regulator [Actinomadura sp. 6N118]|uniref:AfsR/SARP family transcriptional regulator n=1 Tax=Actinomadura sp. 6N118 TaxID=3375151 RepID=UPI0037B6DC9E